MTLRRMPWWMACLVLGALPARAQDAGTRSPDVVAATADAGVMPDAEVAQHAVDSCLLPSHGTQSGGLALAVNGQVQHIDRVQLTGLTTLTEDQVWRAVLRARPEALTLEQAQLLVDRLVATGVFAEVRPTVRLDSAPGAASVGVLELAVREYPQVRSVAIHGLTEFQGDDLLATLVETPEAGSGWEPADRCADPVFPADLLAHVEHGAFYAGVAWHGLVPGLDRLLQRLHDEGYVLGSIDAVLSPAGDLTVTVDEGRLERVDIEGVPPELEPDVRAELGLTPGQVFLADELERAVDRVEERFPFLSAEVRRSGSGTGAMHIEEQRGADGSRTYATAPGPAEDSLHVDVDLHRHGLNIDVRGHGPRTHLHVGGLHWKPEGPRLQWSPQRGEASVHAKAVDVDFAQSRTDLENHWSELLRHTQVTGFAPGVMLSGWLWDPADRIHLSVDAGLNLNLGRTDHVVDWTLGPRIQLPALRLAELGVQFHSAIDTEDRWRVSRLDSYLHSILFRRPESEYFRRTGLWAFATFHVLERLTLGVEYRRDTYQSLDPLPSVWALFRRDGSYPNPAITDGQMGSGILRVEYSTQKTHLRDVGDPWRALSRSLVERAFYRELLSGLTTVNTLEVSRAELGSDAGLEFLKFTSDTALHIATGSDRGLRVRLRAAGGERLPLQKQEALGGWGSLRGYGFKEFRGDYSVLGSVEYQLNLLSAFADVGSVKTTAGWITPRLGLGAQFNFGDSVALAVAWRTDDRASAVPEVRLTLGRSF